MGERTLLVGIDEAGYGPILGPLVVSAAAFDVPTTCADESLWTILQSAVTDTSMARGGRIAIVDSKKLHKPKEGIARLERSALAVLGAGEGLPADFRLLLARVAPQVPADLNEYPWYRAHNPSLPTVADEGAVRISANLLKRTALEHDCHPAALLSEVLPEGHYNRLVDRTQNKAVVLLGLTLKLMQRAADAFPNHDVRFLIDKQGARAQYGPILMRSFEDRRLRILAEQPDFSAYELVRGPSTWRVQFCQSGESHHLPTAMASILSKYLRELFMMCFNQYWRSRDAAIRPTAGYYEDGLRFLKDIDRLAQHDGVPRELLVRSR